MITGTEIEYQSDAGSTKDTPYLTLTGKLWGAFCEYLWENWLRMAPHRTWRKGITQGAYLDQDLALSTSTLTTSISARSSLVALNLSLET